MNGCQTARRSIPRPSARTASRTRAAEPTDGKLEADRQNANDELSANAPVPARNITSSGRVLGTLAIYCVLIVANDLSSRSTTAAAARIPYRSELLSFLRAHFTNSTIAFDCASSFGSR